MCVGGSPPGSPTDVYSANGMVQPNGSGVVLNEIRPGTPAQKAGLHTGDVIVRINGQKVTGSVALSRGDGEGALEPRRGGDDIERDRLFALVAQAVPHARSETARRYLFDDGVGEIWSGGAIPRAKLDDLNIIAGDGMEPSAEVAGKPAREGPPRGGEHRQ